MKDILKGIVFTTLFAVPFIPLIVADSMFFPYITGKNFSFRILVEIMCGAWILLALLDATYRPRFSWMFAGIAALVGVMFLANLFGEFPPKSFWSNFERMDGYVTLVHFFLYALVLASTLRDNTKLWYYYLWTSVAAAGYVAVDGLREIGQDGPWRIYSTLGNAAYMAVYMLFHVFFGLYLAIQSKTWWARSILALLCALFATVLIYTATRGTFIGLVAGLGVTVVYLLLFAKSYPRMRKGALAGLIALIVCVGAIFAFKDSTYISEHRVLDRFANISIDDLAVRFDIWGIAYEGFKERPLLGWGQENFNYVFNTYYNPDLYSAEPWYDRAHNVMLDWLIAGGMVAFLAYISIFAALVYYLVVRPFRRTEQAETGADFSVGERAVLIGLLVAYFTHNLVIFDNIVSYIFFAVLLALIHGKLSSEIRSVTDYRVTHRIVTQVAAPAVIAGTIAIVYFVNVPGLTAGQKVIDALTASTPETRLTAMQEAIAVDSFAYQEIVEQLSGQTQSIVVSPQVPVETKKAYVLVAERELLKLAEWKPNDARVHIFIANFYRSLGAFEPAKTHIDRARALSPNKQTIILEQGIIAHQMDDTTAMHAYFKEAYALQPEFKLARTLYAASLMYEDRTDEIDELITAEYFDAFAGNEFALQSAVHLGETALAVRMYEARLQVDPQLRPEQFRADIIGLATVLHEAGSTAAAITTLQAGVDAVPSFATRGTCYITNLQNGTPMTEGCAD